MSIVSLDVKTIRLVIDNFDSIGYSSKRYQTYIYNLLKKYLNIIITISDRTVLNSDERQNNLSKNNELIDLYYNLSVEHVKRIIEMNFEHENIRTSINFVLSDLDIAILINKTNGNIFDILSAVRYLYSNIENLKREEYRIFLLNYIDKEINKNPLISGVVKRERILHIK